MTASPRVAVLLPVRNAADTLPRTLAGLLRQTHRDLEILTVDDGSSDGTPELVRRLARGDGRIRPLRNPGRGIVDALEHARARTDAPFLARMDADDLVHRERVALQLEHLVAHPGVAAVGCRVRSFPIGATGPGWRRYERWLNGLLTPADHAREIFIESPLAHPSVLLRAEAVAAVGGYRHTDWAEDYDLWLRLHAAGRGLAKVPRVLLGWRHHPGRLSRRDPRYDQARFMDARAHYLARFPAVTARPVTLWGAGRTGRRLTRRLLAAGVRVRRIYDVSPARIGSTCHGVPVESWRALPPAGDAVLLGAVGAPGARAIIRPEAERRGYREGVDLFFAA